MNDKITLATLPQATAQQVFNQVARHLLTQARGCYDAAGLCVYRSETGLSCAAGCLISDDEYTPDLEFNAWRELTAQDLVPDVHYPLIDDLQEVHDMFDPEEWVSGLVDIAYKYCLATQVIEEMETAFQEKLDYQELDTALENDDIVQRCTIDQDCSVVEWHDVDSVSREWHPSRYRVV